MDLRAAVAEAAVDFEEPRRCTVQALLHPAEPLLVLGLSEEEPRGEAFYLGRKHRTLVVDWTDGTSASRDGR